MSARSVLAGALALAVLETLLDGPNASRLDGVFGFPAAVTRWIINPDVPGLPDVHGAKDHGAAGTPAKPVPTPILSGQAPTSAGTFTTDPLNPLGLPNVPRFTVTGSSYAGAPGGASASVSISPPNGPAPVPVPKYV